LIFKNKNFRWVLSFIALGILLSVYLFQRFVFSPFPNNPHPEIQFILNRTLRLLLNDIGCMILIAAIFNKSSYLRLGFYIFLVELLILLPVYLFVKLTLEGDSEISSPLLSQWHRMIVNPLLMIVLMFGLFYQDYFINKIES
jgi:exosortase F-associated protein